MYSTPIFLTLTYLNKFSKKYFIQFSIFQILNNFIFNINYFLFNLELSIITPLRRRGVVHVLQHYFPFPKFLFTTNFATMDKSQQYNIENPMSQHSVEKQCWSTCTTPLLRRGVMIDGSRVNKKQFILNIKLFRIWKIEIV